VPIALAVLCCAWAVHARGLAAGAGNVPSAVALLTLATLAADWWLTRRSAAGPARPKPAPQLDATLPALLAAIFTAGFLVVLPLYAAWSYRLYGRRAVAIALAATLGFLLFIDTQVRLYRGLFWPE
jgi:hypothetical protein